MTRLEAVIDQICAARRYSLQLIEHVDPADWFRMPAGGVTHVAWQVGHLAVAQFGLSGRCIDPGARDGMHQDFSRLFGKGSVPVSDAGMYPTPAELHAELGRIHQQTIDCLQQLPEEILDEQSSPQHPMFSTRLGALIWLAQHEFSHAGQIGLLRRLLGHDALW